jgi:hypothetical protein
MNVTKIVFSVPGKGINETSFTNGGISPLEAIQRVQHNLSLETPSATIVFADGNEKRITYNPPSRAVKKERKLTHVQKLLNMGIHSKKTEAFEAAKAEKTIRVSTPKAAKVMPAFLVGKSVGETFTLNGRTYMVTAELVNSYQEKKTSVSRSGRVSKEEVPCKVLVTMKDGSTTSMVFSNLKEAKDNTKDLLMQDQMNDHAVLECGEVRESMSRSSIIRMMPALKIPEYKRKVMGAWKEKPVGFGGKNNLKWIGKAKQG